MVLDSKQNPHISYVDFGTGSGSKLHYMYLGRHGLEADCDSTQFGCHLLLQLSRTG